MCNICNLDDLNHLRYCSPKYLNKPTFPHFTVAVHSWQINLLLGDLEKRSRGKVVIVCTGYGPQIMADYWRKSRCGWAGHFIYSTHIHTSIKTKPNPHDLFLKI